MAGSDPDTPKAEPPPVYRADLTKGMEHMRPYVSVAANPKPLQSQAPQPAQPAADPPTYGVPASALPSTKATSSNHATSPHAQASPSNTSHSSTTTSNPEHRADPSKFGSRYLSDSDDIFAFNAWDDVPLTPDFLAFAEAQYALQRGSPVSAFDAARFNDAPARWWDRFYANNAANFFKDRRWLFKEFPVLQEVCAADAGPVRVLEVGCGAGNTAFPLMKQCENRRLTLHACDFSAKAVEVVRASELFDGERMRADVWDVAAAVEGRGEEGQVSLPPGVEVGSVDLVILVFVFSALSPLQWGQALRNVNAALRPGGQILFRDYGRGDLAQVRFKKGRWLEENFYVRGDGTRVYFFERDELAKIFGGDGSDQGGQENVEGENKTGSSSMTQNPTFEILDLKVDRRMLVNRQRRLKMYRCWMQGHFRKSPG